MSTLNDLRDAAHRTAVEHGFKDASVGEDFMLMVTEIAEAMEDHRNGEKTDAVWYEYKPFGGGGLVRTDDPVGSEPRKPCGIPSEMADVIIRVLHFAGKHGIDIQRAVDEKMAYNASRPMKHGGKVL